MAEQMNLDREDFRQWLVSKEPDEVVGEAGHPFECPAARWLCEQEVGVWWLVSGTSYGRVGDDAYEPLPEWTVQLAIAVDRRPKGEPVTAKEALTILDDIDG